MTSKIAPSKQIDYKVNTDSSPLIYTRRISALGYLLPAQVQLGHPDLWGRGLTYNITPRAHHGQVYQLKLVL